MTDEALNDLYDYIAGKGQYAFYRGGFHTYPGSEHDPLHCACEELERQGRIQRIRDEPGHVIWRACENFS